MKFYLIIKILFSCTVSIMVLGFTYKLENTNIQQQKKEAWLAPKDSDNLKNPFTDKKSSALDGKKTFVQYCISCHGNEGIGNGPASVSLNPKPGNLTSKVVQKQSDGNIFWKVSNGRGAMVAWKFTLSEKQRWQLVNYVRELGKKSR